jgi:cytochrome bd ubiquinol oxidase subunit II
LAWYFRWRDPGHRRFWDIAFCGGSVVATIAQGITLGALLQGIHVEGRAYGGGWWDWLTPFTLLTGVSLVAGYALLGAGWLIWKTDGPTQAHARKHARMLTIALVGAIVAVSTATPFLDASYYQRWFGWPGVLAAAQMPLLVAIAAFILWRSIDRGRDWLPFAMTLLLFGLSMAGLAISIWPDVIPGRVSIWDAAAPERSQVFMLIGAGLLVPVILAYTAWAYWVFRGKVDETGYH